VRQGKTLYHLEEGGSHIISRPDKEKDGTDQQTARKSAYLVPRRPFPC